VGNVIGLLCQRRTGSLTLRRIFFHGRREFGGYATHTPGTATFSNKCGEATAEDG
jgi:hypothetical protein